MLHVLKLARLWPDEWSGILPLELRRVKVRFGSRLSMLDDFPALRSFLWENFDLVHDGPCEGDVVTMRWGSRDGGAHHVVLWAGFGFYHLPFEGVSGWHQTGAEWNERIVDVWRLKNSQQGENHEQ